jgi:arylsulfatase A-like enzyme
MYKSSRREIIQTTCWLLLPALAGLFAACAPAGSNKATLPPNIVLIMTDDQGYGEFSCNGNPLVQTPNLDRLAKEGISFTDFHVCPMCTPTRAELMTGMDAFRTGAVNVSSGRTLLRPELKTMADVFQEAGYRTGIFGKWHLGDNYPFRPGDRGFGETVWFPSSHINSVPDYWDNDYFDDTYIHNAERKAFRGYCTDVFFEQAIRWMEEVSEKKEPFFTYIPLNAAHWPHFVPDRYRMPVSESFEAHPEWVGHLPESRQKALISFLAMGLNIDENVGRLMDYLESAGLLSNTIVVFLTDNGSTFGPDYYNAGMKGRKTELWEGGHRVPLFIKAPPEMFPQPSVIDQLCQVQDLLPTLATLAGIGSLPENLDGMDLSPLIRGEKFEAEDRMLVINYSRMPQFRVSYTTGNPAIPQKEGAAVLWKNWRLLENRELYEVDSDPHQDQDVASEYPEIFRQMSDHLDQWWEGVKDDVMEVQRIVIGHEAENPMMITACEWLNVFVDQQVQIRRGVPKNGVWHITVDRPGVYEFELRRWPRESGLSLRESVGPTTVTDGSYVEGSPLDIRSARIRIGEKEAKKSLQDTDHAAVFQFELEAGHNTLETWFYDGQGETLCGAYYVYINRIRQEPGPR